MYLFDFKSLSFKNLRNFRGHFGLRLEEKRKKLYKHAIIKNCRHFNLPKVS